MQGKGDSQPEMDMKVEKDVNFKKKEMSEVMLCDKLMDRVLEEKKGRLEMKDSKLKNSEVGKTSRG